MAVKKSTRRIQANRRREFDPLFMEDTQGRVMVQYRDGGPLTRTEERISDPTDILTPTSEPHANWAQNWLNRRRPELYQNMTRAAGGKAPDISKFNKEFYRQAYNFVPEQNIYYDYDEAFQGPLEGLDDESKKRLSKRSTSQRGAFFPEQNTIVVNPDLDERQQGRTIMHEQTHAMTRRNNPGRPGRRSPQEGNIRSILRNPEVQNRLEKHLDSQTGPTAESVKESEATKNYHYDPWEIYSRLMEIRFDAIIDPTETIDKKRLKEIKKNTDNYLFELLDDETLIELLNTTAQDTTLSQEDQVHDLPMAKDGGSLPQYGVGSWLKRNVGNLAKGVLGTGLMLTGAGASVGLPMIAGAASGVAGDAISESSRRQAQEEDERLNRYRSLREGLTDETVPYAPTYKKGGMMKRRRKPMMAQGGIIDYGKGQTHEGPDGGVPVDAIGNVASASQEEAVALTEKGELSWLTPEGETYVFSDQLKIPASKKSFAEEAKRISNKYKLYLGKDFDKHDKLSSDSMNRELDQLMMIQESIRGNTYTQKDVDQMMAQQPEMPMGGADMASEMGGMDMGGMDMPMDMMQQEQMPMMRRGGKLRKYPEGGRITLPEEFHRRAPSLGPGRVTSIYGDRPAVDPTTNMGNTEAGAGEIWDTFQGGVPLTSLAVPLLGNLSGMIGERMRRSQRSNIRLPRATARTVSYEPARTAHREIAGEQRAAGRRGYRNLGASPGATMAGTSVMETGINRQLGQSLAESYMQEGIANVELATEAERANMEMGAREAMLNREQRVRDEDVSRGYRDAVWGSINQYLADVEASKQQASFLGMMQPEFEIQEKRMPRRDRLWRRPKTRVGMRRP